MNEMERERESERRSEGGSVYPGELGLSPWLIKVFMVYAMTLGITLSCVCALPLHSFSLSVIPYPSVSLYLPPHSLSLSLN